MRRSGSPELFWAAPLLLLASCSGNAAQEDPAPSPAEGQEPVGLFSTLPIYWGEGGDIETMLDSGGEPGWVRGVLEEEAELRPLDTLEPEALDGLSRAILAQPRPLAPSENVSFDAWLRAGGMALILADPMLTQHSDYSLGDPRRPHDMVVISPILAHWGLELVFDEEQPSGEREIGGVPVDLAGHFIEVSGDAEAECALEEGGLIADCRIGEGRALLVADAALVDDHHDEPHKRAVLRNLLGRIFAD